MMKLTLLITSLWVYSHSTLKSLLSMAFILFSLSFWMKQGMPFFSFYSSLSWDWVSFLMLALTFFTILVSVMASMVNSHIKIFNLVFNLAVISLLTLIFLFFSAMKTLFFYILFEASLIPTFILILGWGYQPERSQAGTYLLMYTVLASLPFLISILLFSKLIYLENFLLKAKFCENFFLKNFWAFSCILAFSVKLPIYALHLWLPKAHVEAPVAGSMILASVLLKLGAYGILRFASTFPSLFSSISNQILIWTITGGSLLSLLCILQSDIKFLVAISSVSHMALVLGALLTFSPWGWSSAMMIMMAHGFCSSGLFFLTYVFYERTSTRNLFIMKGLQTLLPSLTLFSFFLAIFNMAAPPSLNLLGEMNSLISLIPWSFTLSPQLMTLVFSAAAYSLFLFSQSSHGKSPIFSISLNQSSFVEMLLFSFHLLPLFFLPLTSWLFF